MKIVRRMKTVRRMKELRRAKVVRVEDSTEKDDRSGNLLFPSGLVLHDPLIVGGNRFAASKHPQ